MSRKSLVPIALPADPTAALEAATKQYVDNRAEVNISTAGPSPRVGQLLWVDTDANPTPAPVGWQQLTLQGAWINYGGWAPAAWRQVGDVVEVRGLIVNGLANSLIANLPQPLANLIFVGADGSGFVRLDMMSSGQLIYGGAATSTYTSLSMVRYSVL